MAKIIPVLKKVNRALQKVQREQERKAKRIHAQRIRQEKDRLRNSIQVQKQIEKGHREQERQAKRVHAAQIRLEKAQQNHLIQRGKLALSVRLEEREQLKNSMLNLKVNT